MRHAKSQPADQSTFKYLIDTDVIIDYLKGKQESVALLHNLINQLAISTISLAELYEGIYGQSRAL